MKVSHNTFNLLYRFTDLLSLKVIALVKKIRLDTGITSTVLDIYSRHNQSLSSQLIIGTWNSVNVPVSKGKLHTSNIKMEDSSSDGDAGAYDYDHREEKSDEDEGENDSGEEQWRNQVLLCLLVKKLYEVIAEFCAIHGIRHEFTAPYSPQQNGIAERKNRTLTEMVTAMLISSAKVAVPTPEAQKIGPKSVDCIFIGYAMNNSAYRFIVHESKNPDIQKNTVMESRNASFFEHIFPCLSKETGSSARLDDEVVQDKRQRDDNDLQDERQDQT
ncbi:retrotransposon protein, putative, ty1-copia subclass, partial [Tanacetum coccineum]